MKKLIGLFLTLALIVIGCGNDKTERTYSGKVYVDHMEISGGTATAPGLRSAELTSLLTSSLSDTISTITTTFQGGDISISGQTMALLQGSITNDTPNQVKGFWYCAGVIPTAAGPSTEAYWRHSVDLASGGTYTFQGGMGFGANPNTTPTPGEMIWTVYFFDTTNDPAAPVGYENIDVLLAYAATHTPRAAGSIFFSVVP